MKPMPFQEQIETLTPVLVANDKENIIQPGRRQGPAVLDRHGYARHCPLPVIDRETLKLVQALRLHKAVDYTASAVGSAALLRSMFQPSTVLPYIRSRQTALDEIASNDKLRQALSDLVYEYSREESALFKFCNKGLYALFPYPDLKRARHAASTIVKPLPASCEAESLYLKTLMAYLREYEGSDVDRMLQGSIYKTFGGLQPGKRIGFLTPKLKFVPRRFTKWLLAGPAVALAPYALTSLSLAPLITSIGLAWTGMSVFYGLFIKPVRDTGNYIEPLRVKCIYDQAFNRAIDAVAMLDELLAIHRFAKASSHATVLPTVCDEDRHFFEATGLKNPVVAGANPDFVPNDVNLHGARLTFISGPNSGGKTTLCKSVVHNQLLAQMGAYVMAEKATINIADMIRYQAPKFDGLQDDEGRFGTELSRTRDIFYATSPKSLVIMDELAEGTTYEEKLQESYGILDDFQVIGNNTILVTHNHALAERFAEEQKGRCLMTAFDGDEPTYKLVPGLARVSRADRIVKKIKFSKEDRHAYLQAKGYI